MSRDKITNRKIVIVNQATNYLTVGFCNAFARRFEHVILITGSIHEQGERLNSVVRVCWINKWNSDSSIRKLMAYVLGFFQIFWLLTTKYRGYEVVFISVPPMGYILNTVCCYRVSIIVWDVFPDAFKIAGLNEKNVCYRFLSYLNKKSFQKAFKIYAISDRMADLLSRYCDREKIIVLPIWSIFQANERIASDKNPFVKSQNLEDKFVVQYSGNIGLTHRVGVLIQLAEKMKDHSNILFQIIGRGPRKPFLEKLVKEKRLPNCLFLPFQSDDMFPYSLSAADLGVVVLDAITAKGSVPSKSYNLMSFGIPALYIAADDSQLHVYADKYDHARCYNEQEPDKALQFILQMASDKEMYARLSENALAAAKDFKRENADKFVEKYLEENQSSNNS